MPFHDDEILQGIAEDPTTGHPLLVTAVTAPAQGVLHTWTWTEAWTLQLTPSFPQIMTRPALASITRSTPAGTGPGVLMIFGTASGTETWSGSGSPGRKRLRDRRRRTTR